MTLGRRGARAGGGYQPALPLPREIPLGGDTGAVVTKLSSEDFDYDWRMPTATVVDGGGGGGGGSAPAFAAFGRIKLTGDADLVATLSPDILTFSAPDGTIVGVTNPVTKTIALAANVGTVAGSVMSGADSRVTHSLLTALRALATPVADRLAYYTSATAMALATFTAFGRTLVAVIDQAAGRTALGLDVEQLTAAIDTVAVKTYHIEEYAETAGTITHLTRRCGSGSCTVSVQINGANVTGLATLPASTTQVRTAATAANTFAVGARISIVVTANTSALDALFTLRITR